jgi:hypothetical protein
MSMISLVFVNLTKSFVTDSEGIFCQLHKRFSCGSVLTLFRLDKKFHLDRCQLCFVSTKSSEQFPGSFVLRFGVGLLEFALDHLLQSEHPESPFGLP